MPSAGRARPWQALVVLVEWLLLTPWAFSSQCSLLLANGGDTVTLLVMSSNLKKKTNCSKARTKTKAWTASGAEAVLPRVSLFMQTDTWHVHGCAVICRYRWSQKYILWFAQVSF